MTEEKSPVEQIHADNPQGLLLQGVLRVQHPHVQDDLAVLVARILLETDSHPAVTFVGAQVVAGGNGVGKGEEGGRVAPALLQAVEGQFVLVVEHRIQPRPEDIAIARAVDGVADGHVVSRNALGDRAGRAAHVKEPPHHLLPGANLGKSAIAALVEVDGQRFVVGAQNLMRHGRRYSWGGLREKVRELYAAPVAGLVVG